MRGAYVNQVNDFCRPLKMYGEFGRDEKFTPFQNLQRRWYPQKHVTHYSPWSDFLYCKLTTPSIEKAPLI